MRVAIYPGSFDPFTKGHLDIVQRATKLFDSLIVAVGNNSRKKLLFTQEERRSLVRQDLEEHGLSNVMTESFSCTLAEFIAANNVSIIVRGLRNHIDLINEAQMAQANRLIHPGCDTIFFVSSHSFISSSIIKEIAGLKGDVTKFVSLHVAKALQKKLIQD